LGKKAMDHRDPFEGTWKFNAAKSRLSSPPPVSWIQVIKVSPRAVEVREEVSRANGLTSAWTVTADFDGSECPVVGSELADTIAYTRKGESIIGVARKDGAISLRETIVVSPE
jgi:hypothetical protein